MQASILTIGDELLLGDTQDANSHYLIGQCRTLNIQVVQSLCVQDNSEDIQRALAYASLNSTVILMTGGLGPTADDITLGALAAYLNVPLTNNVEAKKQVLHYRKKQGSTLYNEKLWQHPQNATALFNPVGLAPGMWLKHNKHCYIALVGVPIEMQSIFEQAVRPKLQALYQTNTNQTKTTANPTVYAYLHTLGLRESLLNERVKAIPLGKDVHLAYLPKLGRVSLRLQAPSAIALTLAKKRIKEALGQDLYSEQKSETPAQAIAHLLITQQWSLAIAESCTGGYLTHLFTQHSGASRYLIGSLIAYHNRIKTDQLHVPTEILNTQGAVSEATVQSMATQIRTQYNSTVGLATSGMLSEAENMSNEKLGQVWLACDYQGTVLSRRIQVASTRAANVVVAAHYALRLLLDTMRQVMPNLREN